MNFEQKLGSLKKMIDGKLEHYFDAAIKDAQKKDSLVAESLELTKKIALAGGKRIRAALLMQAYFGFGGKEKGKILKVAVAIELVHLFLLMHDDIIDSGNYRHGQPTLHKALAKKYEKKYGKEAAEKFGISMAIVIGEMLYADANRMIAESGFEKSFALVALSKLQTIVSTTIIGQTQDIRISFEKKISSSQILAMYENKTARYTFEGPLQMGAILADCKDKKSFELLSCYAIPLGIAFQLQDDILGVFGNEKKIGKSASSDIEEGKKTLLVAMAFANSSEQQALQMENILGLKNLKSDKVKEFQKILTATGSLEYCKKLAKEYFQTGKTEIEKIIILPDAKKFLLGMIEYLEKREI